jgi:UDP-N-acetylmuramate dehydrogenase
MMAARRASERLIERLPPVRGRLTENVPLAPITWFRAGGAAEIMFRPADIDDLAGFLARRPADVPVTVIGVASNLLVRDGGVAGVVIRLGRGFVDIRIDGAAVEAGAGALDLNVALACREAGVAGLEFMSGIPGTVGGGLRMNAGAYGREFKDVLHHAVALDAAGNKHVLPVAALGLSYRHSTVAEDWILVQAVFAGEAGDAAAIGRRMGEIQAARESSQPIRARTGGSTFANPPGHKAWELIDRAGCRGLVRGGAQVSEKHTNFLINTGKASAADLEGLGEEVRRRVFAETGITLEWEIKRVGVALPGIAEVAP